MQRFKNEVNHDGIYKVFEEERHTGNKARLAKPSRLVSKAITPEWQPHHA